MKMRQTDYNDVKYVKNIHPDNQPSKQENVMKEKVKYFIESKVILSSTFYFLHIMFAKKVLEERFQNEHIKVLFR